MDGHIPEDLITKIRGSQDIVEVISRHLSLRKSGQNYIGLCPFHSEKTPSFVVSPVKQLFHCFGCGTGGNVITFLMRYENIPFPDAIRRLAQDAGIVVPERFRKGEEENQPLFDINNSASDYYEKILSGGTKEAAQARRYLAKRGLSEETIKRFHIGYAMNSWNAIYNHLKKKGFKDTDLIKSGIVVPKSHGAGYFDRFRNRIMLPIYNVDKQVVGFGGRVLDDATPKYINSSESPLFSKGHLLYGLNIAKESIRKEGYSIVVEGYLDAISAHQAGVNNVVATLGTAFTSYHLRILSRFCKEIVLTFDADKAGVNAAMRTVDLIINSGLNARVLLLPTGEDPDSFIRRNGSGPFIELAKKSQNLIKFALERIIEEGLNNIKGNSIESKLRVIEGCLSIVRKMENRIERDLYLDFIARKMGIEKNVLLSEMKRRTGKGTKKASGQEKSRNVSVNRPKAEEILLTLIIRDWAFRKMIGDVLSIEDFSDPQFQEIAGYLLNSDQDINDLVSSEVCSQEVRDIITKMAVNDIQYDSPEKTLSDCIKVLQRNRLERELKEIERKIASAEIAGMFEEVRGFLQEKQGLMQKKKILYEN